MGLSLALVLAALFAFVLGERILPDASPLVWAARALAGACLLGSLVVQRLRARDRKLLALTSLVVVGMAAYAALLAAGRDVLEPLSLLAYVVPLALASFGLVAALRAHQAAPFDAGMAADCVRSAVAFGLLCVALGLANFWVHGHDLRVDLSYRRPSEPSQAARELLGRLREPLEITLLFEPGSEVEEAARPYFEALRAHTPRLSLRTLDAAAAPALVKAARVRGNGYALLSMGTEPTRRHEAFLLGRDLAGARPVLRALDGHVVHHLSALLVPARRIYLTAGHGERSVRGAPDEERGRKLADFEVLLARFNVQLAGLGLVQGLGHALPEDAAAVLVLGPAQPFLDAERDSLLAYVERGGKLLLALEPGVDAGLGPLLERLGLAVSAGVVSCSEHHLVRSRTPLDRELLFTRELLRSDALPLAGARVHELGAVFVRSAAVSLVGAPEGVKRQMLVQSGDDCSLAGSAPGVHGLIASSSLPGGGRAVLLGDADFFSDQILRNTANTLVTLDLVRSLLGKDAIRTEVLGDDDLPIEHTAAGERAFFYGTSFAMPLALFALSFAVRRRRVRTSAG